MGEPRYLDANGRMVGLVYACTWRAACHVDRCDWEAVGNDPGVLDRELGAHLTAAHHGRVFAVRVTVP